MRRLGLIALWCAMLVFPLDASAARLQVEDARLDAPAIVPNADELSEAGLDGYTLTTTGFYTHADDVDYLASVNFVEPEVADELLTETGRVSSYLALLTLLADAEDPTSDLVRELQITVFTFADEEGAAEAFAFMSDESNDPGAEDVRGGEPVGDASELTRRTGDQGALEGVLFQELELQFQIDRLVIYASFFVYGEDADAPSIEEMDPVGALLVERAEAILDGDTAGLTLLVPRFEQEQGAVPYAAYWQRDGVHVPSDRETADDVEARVESYGGATDLLSYQQQLPYGEEGADDDFLYTSNLLKFETAEDARAFFDASEERAVDSPGFVEFVVLDDAPAFGDASIVIDRTSLLDGDEWRRFQFNMVIDAYVVAGWIAQVVPDAIVPLDPLYELAAAQERCLREGECGGTIEVPAGIVDGEAEDDAGDFPAGRNEEDEDAAGDEAASYESPQYGYTLTYESAEWVVSDEDADPEDAYDRVVLQSTGLDGFVMLVGDPDYAPDEMSDCVADYIDGFDRSEGVSDVAPMRGGEGEAAGRAWAALSFVLEMSDGELIDAVRYIECRALDDVTVVILQTLSEADYEAVSAARETLMRGLDS